MSEKRGGKNVCITFYVYLSLMYFFCRFPKTDMSVPRADKISRGSYAAGYAMKAFVIVSEI